MWVYGCLYMCARACICIYMKAKHQMSLFTRRHPVTFEKCSLIETWGWLIRLGWAAKEPPELPLLLCPQP